jgi:myosin heavy subunit
VVFGLLCLVAILVGDRRLAFESAEPHQTQKDGGGAKDGALDAQAELKLAELQQRLDGAVRRASETSEIAQGKLKQAESSARELRTRLDATIREAEAASQSKQAELEQARLALAQAQQASSELQTRLEATTDAESKTAAAAQARLQQDQATIADLEARLDAAKCSAREAAAASTARLKQMEENIVPVPSEIQGEQLVAAPGPLAVPSVATGANAHSSAQPKPLEQLEEGGALASVPRAKRKSAGIAKREKIRDDQIDLFEGQIEPGQTLASHDANPRTTASAKGSRLPTTELAQTSAASATREAEKVVPDLVADRKPVLEPMAVKPAPARRLAAPPPVNPAQLRKAVNEILPLLAEQDPGAEDCLKANRATFRSAFASEAYEEFEQFVKRGEFSTALENLKKAGRRHGISL